MSKLAGPVLTLFVLILIHFISPVFSLSLAPAFVVLVWTAYVGGTRPAIISTVLIVSYMTIAYPPDYGRLAQSGLSVIAIAVMVIVLKRRAAMSETLNGNIARLKDSLNIVRSLKVEWDDLSDHGRKKRLDLVEDRIGNLAALVFGWHSIHKEIEETKAKLDDDIKQPPANIC